ncbi:MAG TPA: type II secretion system F family protein [Symbiobacteriaceae bacterium]|nr:type II secretion system F family protein [Symbiobacteriaceae bacterium]
MTLIGMLMLVACAGSVYAAYVMKKEKERRVAALIVAMESEAQTHHREDPAPPGWAFLKRLLPAEKLAAYERKLLWAGRPYGMDAGHFVSYKLMGALGLPMLVPLITLFQMNGNTFLIMLLAALAGFILPDVWLNARVAERQRMVAEELPLFADLVATAVSAGLPLTEAVRKVAADAPGLVAREFLRAVQEMAAGKPRQQAWRDLVDRVPGDDFRVIVNAIMQAEQYGTSVAEIIRYQVQQIRLFKQQEAQRIAQSVTVKMRIPMLLLILLPFMVLLLGPALLQLAELLL